MLQPRDLYNIKEEFEEMNLFEIRNHIKDLELKGADNTLMYRIEMHKRIASPVAIIILTVIGASLSSRRYGIASRNWNSNNIFLYIVYGVLTRVRLVGYVLTLHSSMAA